MNNDTFIDMAGVEMAYPLAGGRTEVLSDLDFGARRGEVVTILGVSGTGKSTLLNIIGGIDRAIGGRVCVDGADLARLSDRELTVFRRRTVGFVFQFYNLIPSLTALENVLTALEASGAYDAAGLARAQALLAAVGIGEKAGKFPEQLSGGEQQRVAIARALVKHPPLILADEPTGNLDPDTGESVLELLVGQARTTGATLIIVTHNPAVAHLTDRTLALAHGQLRPA